MVLVLVSGLALTQAACKSDADAKTPDVGVADLGSDTDAGLTDGGFDAAGPDLTSCPDDDGDGFASASCGGADCDDTDGSRYPGATEFCDDDDEDCDPTTFGPDGDGDGFEYAACCNGPGACGSDCDDTRPAINPTGVENCNLVDDDCDGEIDEAVSAIACFDGDGDGRGPVDVSTVGCTVPVGATTTCNDCADAESGRYIGQMEACNLVDDDCDGAVDEGCECTTGASRPCGREVGACVVGTQRCLAGLWESACDGAVLPSPEVCNTVDDDCDGMVDEDVKYAFFADCDRDGYGDSDRAREACVRPVGVPTACSGGYWSMTGEDCDDADPGENPTLGCPPAMDGGVPMDAGPPRFTSPPPGIVVDDALTGLQWQAGMSPSTMLQTFSQAQEYCASGSGLPGEGWRLPTAMEAIGLLDFSLSPPVDSIFDAMTPATVWTASTYMTSDGMVFARVVWFDEGIVSGSCTSSGCANRTRCVRGP
jgi:hypothetical protein